MPLIDTDSFAEHFRLPAKQVNPAILSHAVAQASVKLTEWLGSSAYQAAVSAKSPGPYLAELYLAAWYAWPIIGHRIRTDGAVIEEAVEPEGKSTRRYLTPEQSATMRQQFWDAARQAAGFEDGIPEGAILTGSRIPATEACIQCWT